jgi:hypothetical protein
MKRFLAAGPVALLGLAVLSTFWTLSAQGQAVSGSIFGTVTDPSGAAVPNVKVTVTDVAKGTSEQTTTNETGNYSSTHLIPDNYSVSFEAPGFKVSKQENVVVTADAAARVDGQFQVGSSSESVEVTSEAPQLKTDRSDVAIEFNEKYVEDLPIMNRNFTSFELLSPGTQKMVGWSHAATENPQGSQQIFVNGQHFSGTAFELDGTDNQDPILGIIVVNPNLDAIQESKITLQNYDAEFGKAVAGVVTVQTKSGSNDLHGGGFWFRRTDATAARDPFTQYAPNPLTGKFIPSDKWQQFGGTIGGPIIKNKLFFFGDYQGTREKNGTTNLLTVPTATVASSCNPATNASSATPGFCDLHQYLGAEPGGNTTLAIQGGQVFDPATGSGGLGRSSYLNNQIPVAQISPQAAAILALFPAPTNSAVANNYVASGSGSYKQDSFDTRIDFNPASTLQVFGRFSLDYFNVAGQGSYGPLEGVGFGPGGLSGSSITHNYSLASGVTKTFSSTLLADFRFGYFKYNPLASKPDSGSTPMNTVGIPNANQAGAQALSTSGWGGFLLNQTISNSSAFGGAFGNPTVSWGDGLGVGRCNCPLTESEQQFQWVTNWTKIHGNHQFKFGADVRYAMNLRVPSDAGRTGDYTFDYRTTSGGATGGVGGLDWATFLLGDVTQVSRYVSSSLNAAERQHRMFYYGQDTWRINQKLTFNYGLRWEVYFPEYVNGKDQGGFANLFTGEDRVAGEGGIGLNGNINNAWHAFAPRIGVAYQVSQKTVVRLGYGRSFDMGVFGSNFGHTVTQTLPVLAAQLAQGASQEVPAFTLAQGPPIFSFPAIPSNGLLPVSGPNCYQQASIVAGQNTQLCVQPHIRPTTQRLPTLDAWNATVQHQVSNTISVEAAYIGNKGTHVFAGDGPTYNINQPSMVGYCADSTCSTITPQQYRRPLYNKFTYSGYPDPTNTLANLPGAPRIVPGVLQCCSTDQGNYLGNDASSEYNALQIKVEKRFAQGFQFLSHYTFAHANKYDNNYYADDPRVAYGPDDQVRDHVWVNNLVYELPFGRNKAFGGQAHGLENVLIGGWQITGTTTWGSGLPWTPSTNECGGEEDVGVCRPSKGSGSFQTGAGSLQHNPATGAPFVQFFTPLTSLSGPFADPGKGQLGNIGVFSYRGPRAFYSDASIMKNFTVTERVKAQFRMDAFNVFNHPVLGFNNNQGGSGQCIDCAGNGQITDIEHDGSPGSATGMRQLEFALKFSF